MRVVPPTPTTAVISRRGYIYIGPSRRRWRWRRAVAAWVLPSTIVIVPPPPGSRGLLAAVARWLAPAAWIVRLPPTAPTYSLPPYLENVKKRSKAILGSAQIRRLSLETNHWRCLTRLHGHDGHDPRLFHDIGTISRRHKLLGALGCACEQRLVPVCRFQPLPR